ncbi:hypothetical protein EDD11_005363 [Mortierella claussenii]|nr:hypothetical protein EDD11_005363 [Mortierella claussenii]
MATTSTKHILVVGLGNYTLPGTRHNVGMMVLDRLAERFDATSWSRKNGWEAEIATFTTTITNRKWVAVPADLHDSAAPANTNAAIEGASGTATTTTTAAAASAAASAAVAGESEETTTMALKTPIVRKKELKVISILELKVTLLKPMVFMNLSGTSVSRAVRDLKIPLKDILVVHDDLERDIGKISHKSSGSAGGHNGIKSLVKYLKTQHFKRMRVGIGRPSAASRSADVVADFVLGRFKPFELKQLEELVYDKACDEVIRVTTVDSTPKVSRPQ